MLGHAGVVDFLSSDILMPDLKFMAMECIEKKFIKNLFFSVCRLTWQNIPNPPNPIPELRA